MKNRTDRWAPRLAANLLSPDKMGRTAIFTRWEGGTHVAGEPVGGQEKSYTFHISPPVPNQSRKFVEGSVQQEGTHVCWVPDETIPLDDNGDRVELALDMVLSVQYDDREEAFAIVSIDRAASGFKTAAWRVTGNM